jgi:hypothetical protein
MRHDDVASTSSVINSKTSSKRKKLSDVKDRAKDNTKRTLHIEFSVDDAYKSSYETRIEELNESPAFNSDRFLNRERIGQASLHARAIYIL